MKIVVCALAINDWYREVVKYGLKNLQDYCNLHNYKCIINTENDTDIYDGKRECAWYKIKAIKKVLMTEECDYIVWIDADIQILRQAQNLEYFIKKYLEDTGKDLALIQENPLNFRDICQAQAKKFDTKIFIEKIKKEISDNKQP